MLFNSSVFIFGFLPTVFIVYLLIGRLHRRKLQMAWLMVASLFFYAWWNPPFLLLLVGSVVANFGFAHFMGGLRGAKRHALFVVMVVGNLAPLFVFKYYDFFAITVNGLTGAEMGILHLAFPLGISFFTFQQIAYVIDVYRGDRESPDFLRYALFVTFFPHLIAGPIVHHKQMIPQFRYNRRTNVRLIDVAVGLSMFTIGFVKKTVIADFVAKYVDSVFTVAGSGGHVSMASAWVGAAGCAVQIYFDFSGYSDMAIGLARLFGVKLPINFNSPFKALSIIEFWRRWHITMTRFFTEYVYNPVAIGLTRRAASNDYGQLHYFAVCVLFPTALTCLVIGVWHGAGWNFIVFGAIHALLLTIAHSWRAMKMPKLAAPLSWLVTMVPVAVSFVYFRAHDMGTAHRIIGAMFGATLYEPTIPTLSLKASVIAVLLAGALSLIAPNSIQIMRRYAPVVDGAVGWRRIPKYFFWLAWRPTVAWAIVLGLVLGFALLRADSRAFVYFKI